MKSSQYSSSLFKCLKNLINKCSKYSCKIHIVDMDSTLDMSVNSDIDRSISEFILIWERERNSLNGKAQNILGLNKNDVRNINTAYYDRFQHTYDSTLETYIRNHKAIDGS